MKKLFIALIFNTVLFIGLPNFKVNAMSTTIDIPFTAIPDYVNMLNTILSGGEINIDGISSLEDLQAEWENSNLSTKNFLQRTARSLYDQMVAAASNGEQSLTGNGSTFIYKALPEDLAYFMDYNINWYKYANKLSNAPVVNPDLDYSLQCSQISSDMNGQYSISLPWYLRFDVSPVNALITNNALSYFTDENFNNQTSYIWGSSTLATCYINSANNTLLLTEFSGNPFGFYADSHNQTPTDYRWGNYVNKLNYNSSRDCWGNNNYMPATSISFNYTQSFNSLESAINYVAQHFRGVNLYVDGVLWVSGLSVPEDFIQSPDVISVGDIGTDTYDVFCPDRIEGYGGLSINGFIEWLNQQLGNRTKIGLDDLINDEVPIIIVDDGVNTPTTKPIEIEDSKPVSIVIEGDIIDDNNPTPSVTPSVFPAPPIPDWNFPTDIPGSNIQHTVLAEIIDATQKAVPQDLMILIWSTFGLLVVGGLIYILHK